MDFQLAKGVQLHVIRSDQFKMTNIVINFSTLQTTTNATVRHLLANVLETSCADYPTQTLLSRKLDSLFGAVIGANVARVGQIHTLRLRAQMINDYQAQQPLQAQVIKLLFQLLYHPLMVRGQFDQKTVDVQKKSLAGTLSAMDDDKQFIAYQRLAQLFYDQGTSMYHPSYGELSVLNNLSGLDLVHAYRSMLTRDTIDIFVLGNVNATAVYECFRQWKFADREPLTVVADYHQPFHQHLRQRRDFEQLEQAKLNFAYYLPVFYRDPGYYAALVMNGLLGGTPYSKLFLNVRERAGLAYYADSQLRAFSGHIVIETGISARHYRRVWRLVEEQVEQLQSGQFTAEQFNEVKQSLTNSYQVGLDNPLNIIEHRLVNELSGHPELFDVPAAVAGVTKDDVIAMAQKLKLQAAYYLGGDIDD